jgi:AcrR family transcriptional regulator
MEELIQKITDLFLKYGVKSVTMDDIAKELGISKKTLYLHFTDKKDVVMKSIDFSLNHQACTMKELAGVKGENAIDVLLKVSQYLVLAQNKVNQNVNFDLQKYYPEAWEKLKSFRQVHVFNSIRQNILQGIEEGVFRNDFNVEIICYLYVSHIDNSYSDLLNKSEIRFDELLKTLFIYHIRGIASKLGLDYVEHKLQTLKINN